MDITRGLFSVVNSPSNFPNFITFPWEVFRFRGSQLLIYNEGLFYDRSIVKISKLLNFFLEW